MVNNNIIQSAVLKLALWYLVIIMVLSVMFSGVLYRISSMELNKGLRRQGIFLNQPPPEDPLVFEQFRQNQLKESRERMLQNIWLFNLAILLVGGVGSYWFARRSLKPIQEAMDAQSRFTADASHELRTPLTAMQTEIEVALRNPKLNQEVAVNILRSNLEEVAKLKSLSDGLLRLAREDGKSLLIASVTLEKIANEAVNQVLSLADAQEITITNSASAVTVLGDKQNLVELTVILLDNAIKYSEPKTTIKISTKKHGKYGYLTVADQGQGIKASDLPHIFDRFYRADSSRSKEKVAGYGLGLSIAKKIVELHKGIIETQSTLGKGSIFTVRLPLA